MEAPVGQGTMLTQSEDHLILGRDIPVSQVDKLLPSWIRALMIVGRQAGGQLGEMISLVLRRKKER